MRAADIGLEARVQGVQNFLENPQTRLTIDGLRDEFSEYAELTRGEALLEVIDRSGVVLCQPSVPGWAEMAAAEARFVESSAVRPTDRTLGGLPYRVASARVEALGRRYRVTVAAPMGPAYQALERFHRLLILLLPAVLAFAGAGGYWVSRRALAPVDRMTRAVQAITMQSLDRRLEVPSNDDELRRLASTFNDVLSRLQSAVGDVIRFTADASHELRTPVALVRTTAELALRQERAPHEYRKALDEVLEYARRISALVEDLLVLARTDAGMETRGDTTFDLRQVVSETRHEVEALAERRSVDLRVEVPPQSLIVQGDSESLERLLLILVDNAVKYSRPGGEVRLRLSVAPSARDGRPAALVEVSDDGIGLDPAERERLFERFYRGARARQQAPDGSGLGLAIARTIVERNHGLITLSPAGEGTGHGCRARVLLPLDRVGPP